jgi:hypothetical protein
VSESKIAEWPRPKDEDEVRRLLELARGGDPMCLAALRQVLDSHPEIWQAYGGHARNAWIDMIAGKDLALGESLGRRVGAMMADLAGPSPSPLESLLVDRIGACWLQLSYADATAAQAGEMSIQQGNYLRKRQDSAHRRYLTAVGALAMTRRLLVSSAGLSGSESKKVLSLTRPDNHAGADPLDGGPELPGTSRVMGGSAEPDLVLEFGPPGEDAADSSKRRRHRGSRNQSRS